MSNFKQVIYFLLACLILGLLIYWYYGYRVHPKIEFPDASQNEEIKEIFKEFPESMKERYDGLDCGAKSC